MLVSHEFKPVSLRVQNSPAIVLSLSTIFCSFDLRAAARTVAGFGLPHSLGDFSVVGDNLVLGKAIFVDSIRLPYASGCLGSTSGGNPGVAREPVGGQSLFSFRKPSDAFSEGICNGIFEGISRPFRMLVLNVVKIGPCLPSLISLFCSFELRAAARVVAGFGLPHRLGDFRVVGDKLVLGKAILVDSIRFPCASGDLGSASGSQPGDASERKCGQSLFISRKPSGGISEALSESISDGIRDGIFDGIVLGSVPFVPMSGALDTYFSPCDLSDRSRAVRHCEWAVEALR